MGEDLKFSLFGRIKEVSRVDLMTTVVIFFLAAFAIVGVYVTVKSEQFKHEEMKNNNK